METENSHYGGHWSGFLAVKMSELEYFLNPHSKRNSKEFKDLNERTATMKLLREKAEDTLT